MTSQRYYPHIPATMLPFKRYRLAMGITQAAMAELLGVTRDAIVKFENGTCNPSKTVVLLMQRILNDHGL